MQPFPEFFVEYRSRLIVEEHVKVTLPGAAHTRPTLKVTSEERERWAKEYTRFRRSLSLRARFRLWLWRKISKPDRKPIFDQTQTTTFNEFVNIAIQPRMAHDKSVDTDIRAAIEQRKDK